MAFSIRSLPSLLALLLLAAAPARAEQEPVAALVERARLDYQLGELRAALEGYSRAYELRPLAPLLFNIAQCHRQLAQPAKAAHFYRLFLDAAPHSANAPLARELLAEVEALRDAEELRARESEEHQRRLELAKLELARSRVAADALAAAALDARLLALQGAPSSGAGACPASRLEPAPLSKRWWLWAGVGVAVTGAAAAGVVYAANRR